MTRTPQNKNPKGYTLIELLIIISVMSLLAIYGVNSFSDGTKQLEFDNFVNTVAAQIREARSLSLTGQTVPDYTDFDENLKAHPMPPNDDCPTAIATANCTKDEKVVAAGIGLQFNKGGTSPIIYTFADLHNKGKGDFNAAGSSTINPDFRDAADIIYTQNTLDLSKSALDNFDFHLSDSSSTSQNRLLIYLPPFGDINLSHANDKELLIWFCRKDRTCFDGPGNPIGKVIKVHKISGVPEIFRASEISNLTNLVNVPTP